MAHPAFDTLKYVESLTQAGFKQKQAKALAKAQNKVLTEALETSFVTKTDLMTVEHKLTANLQSLRREIVDIIADIISEQKLMKWMLGLIMTGIAALILKTFF